MGAQGERKRESPEPDNGTNLGGNDEHPESILRHCNAPWTW